MSNLRKSSIFNSKTLLWVIYLALLGVTVPHVAWAFSQFEPVRWAWLGWIAAIAFEGAIAAFTWRLKERIERTPRYRSNRKRLTYRYLNIYSAGLLVAIAVSSLANWAHSVEYGQPFAIFTDYSVHPMLYAVAFGAILPACSLLFARILADVQESEHEEDEAVTEAKATIRELRQKLRQTEDALALAEGAAKFMLSLQAEEARERILAAAQRWPELPQSSVAIIAGASPSYASEVLRSGNGR
jgi:DNA segregation ATPase FtsK/SpoIIIE-like protein